MFKTRPTDKGNGSTNLVIFDDERGTHDPEKARAILLGNCLFALASNFTASSKTKDNKNRIKSKKRGNKEEKRPKRDEEG